MWRKSRGVQGGITKIPPEEIFFLENKPLLSTEPGPPPHPAREARLPIFSFFVGFFLKIFKFVGEISEILGIFGEF